MMKYGPSAQTGKFGTSLMDCGSDCAICCATWYCFECMACRNWANARGEDSKCCHFYCCCPNSPTWTKANIRIARKMPPDQCYDWCCYLFCTNCAVCQDARELKAIMATVGR
jgi:Cys-rich protein (TIGR01571 family)